MEASHLPKTMVFLPASLVDALNVVLSITSIALLQFFATKTSMDLAALLRIADICERDVGAGSLIDVMRGAPEVLVERVASAIEDWIRE